MAGLTNRQALKRIEDVLLTAVDLALRERYYTKPSVAALRSVQSVGKSGSQMVAPDTLAFVTGTSSLYRWSTASTAADTGSGVIKPDDAGVTGRWIRQTNPGVAPQSLMLRGTEVVALESGYLQHVALYEGERNEQDMESRIFARRPCVIIQWLSRDKKNKSTNAGGLSQCDYLFELLIIDFNARGQMTSTRGSEVVSDQQKSPGAYSIAGDLEDLLDGVTGEQLGETAIAFCRTSNLTMIDNQQAGRKRVIMALDIGVWATQGKQDIDAVSLSSLSIQEQLAISNPPGATMDRDNVVRSGLGISTGAGFNRAPSDGSAVIGGVEVTVSGSALHTFDPSMDTYRDLDPNGSWLYTAVTTGSAPPAQEAGTLRVGVTTASAGGILQDVMLASVLRNDGDAFQVAP